jgi:hypothetical protein
MRERGVARRVRDGRWYTATAMSRTAVRCALTVILTLTLAMAAAPVVHQHRGDAPAFYDADCPLSQLAASWSEIGLARAIDLIQPLPALDIALPWTAGHGSATLELPFSPRGPPIPA